MAAVGHSQRLQARARAVSAGKFEDGFKLVQGLVSQKLVLAPRGSFDSDGERYITDFTMSRIMPTQRMVRSIWRMNDERATALMKQGKTDEALRVLAVNAQLAKAMVHTSPPTFSFLGTGNSLWKATWGQIAKALGSRKRQAEMNAANKYSRAAKDFVLLRMRPQVDAVISMAEQTEKTLEKLPESKRDQYARVQMNAYVEKELAASENLLKLWDKEVGLPASVKLLRKMLQ